MYLRTLQAGEPRNGRHKDEHERGHDEEMENHQQRIHRVRIRTDAHHHLDEHDCDECQTCDARHHALVMFEHVIVSRLCQLSAGPPDIKEVPRDRDPDGEHEEF